MSRRNWWRASCACAAMATMMQPIMAVAAEDPVAVKLGPKSSDLVASYAHELASDSTLSHAAKLALLKKNVKYVFVLFQENRSFDHYFSTFPGVNGLFNHPKADIYGFTQPIVNTDGTIGTITPFLIPRTIKDVNGNTVQLYPEDTASVDHSHLGIVNSMDVDANKVSHNDRYVLDQEGFTTAGGKVVSRSTGLPASASNAPTLAQKQAGELMVSHQDCDTIPFLWQYADRFTMFDNFRQTVIGPSTPNAIAMISGQSGLTQAALHPEQASNNTASAAVKTSGGEPMVGDPGPFPGSNLDYSPVKPPYGPNDESPATPALTQTYASLPLSFMGTDINKTIEHDQNPALDLLDVQDDIKTIAGGVVKDVPWGWYQQGYDHEPTDGTGAATYANYITHHNGPQYFGYVGDNTEEQTKLHGLGDFFADMTNKNLPSKGVFYVRGGYGTNDGLVPLDPNPKVKATFAGNDDHPGYSDAQLSEALIAEEVNAIAASPYWNESAIIITYDETDGLYDHAEPHIRVRDPEGNPLEGGPRIPAIVISPYSAVHAIDSAYAEQSSVIKFINELFTLTPLAELPDEVKGFALGKKEFGQPAYGPADGPDNGIDDLFGAFDNSRLTGETTKLPASYAMIPSSVVLSLPHYNGQGCYTLNIIPTDYVGGKLIDPPPADFNPRPGTTPGIPSAGGWTP